MAKLPATTKEIDARVAERPASRIDYFDSAHKGLSLRVGPSSATWYFLRRIDGRLSRIAIGAYPTVGLKEARMRLAELLTAAEAGQHPRAEVARKRSEKSQARAEDESRLARVIGERWLAQHLKPTERRDRALSVSAKRDYRRGLDVFLAEFGDRDLTTIRRRELVRFLRTIKAKSGNEANRTATVVRQLFAFAVDELDMDASPATAIKNPQKPKARARTLTREEIRILWRACELAGYPYGSALQLALCTGQRIGEVGALRRDEIDETGEWWAQSDNKAKRRIDVYLGTLARSVIKAAPDFGRSSFLLSSRGGEAGIRSDVWKFARERHIAPRLLEAAKALHLPPIAKHWTPHDLRRTVRTALTGWCGVTPDIAERVLNHAISGLRAVYDHADYRPHVKDALTRWDAELRQIIAGKAATVVPIAGKNKRRSA